MVFEYRVGWSYGSGAPGVTVLHGRNSGIISDQDTANELALRAYNLFDELKAVFNTTVVFSFPNEVTEMNTTTGVLEDVYAVDGGDNVTGIVDSARAAPAGAYIRWTTPAIVAGRRLVGRTFLVPVAAALYQSDGTILADSITQIGVAAAEYYDTSISSDCSPCVWSRTHGVLADITGHVVPDRVAVLRSRRD